MIGLLLCLLTAPAELGPTRPAEQLVLADALREALAQSPAARRAEVGYQAAVRAAGLTRPRFRPDLALLADGLTAVPQVRDANPAPNAIVRPTFTARVGLTARQLLWHAGGRALTRRADAAVAAAQAEYLAQLATVRHAVVVAWYDLLIAREAYAVADEGVQRAESQRGRVRDLAAVQKVPEVDLLEAEAGVLEARAARVEAANGADLAAANLNRLLGRDDLDRPLRPAPDETLPPPLPLLAQATAYAQAHRPEVLALELRGAEAAAGAAFARRSNRPTLSLTGSASAGTPSAFEPGAEALLGLEFRWPLSRMDNAPARDEAAALASSEQARLGLVELRAGIALEVRRAVRRYEGATARYELAIARTAATTEAHRVKLLQYERDRATLREVREALAERNRAELERARARYEIHQAVADFELATARSLADWSGLDVEEAPDAED